MEPPHLDFREHHIDDVSFTDHSGTALDLRSDFPSSFLFTRVALPWRTIIGESPTLVTPIKVVL
jgi:hypothetical protein